MTMVLPTTNEELHERANAYADKEAEGWRAALMSCTPEQVEEFCGDAITAKELVHQKRREAWADAIRGLSCAVELGNGSGGRMIDITAEGMLRDLGFVTDMPLKEAVSALLKACRKADAADARADSIAVLDALIGAFGTDLIRELTTAQTA
jgi:hypothetical protein